MAALDAGLGPTPVNVSITAVVSTPPTLPLTLPHFHDKGIGLSEGLAEGGGVEGIDA